MGVLFVMIYNILAKMLMAMDLDYDNHNKIGTQLTDLKKEIKKVYRIKTR